MLKGIDTWDVINTIAACIDWAILFAIIHYIGKKNIDKRIITISRTCIYIFMLITSLNDMFPNQKVMICITIAIIYYKLFYEDNIYRCTIVVLLFWLGIMVVDILAVNLTVILNELDSVHVLLEGNIYRLQSVILAKIFLVIQLTCVRYFKLSMNLKPKDMLLIAIPILSNMCSLLLIFKYNLNTDVIKRDDMVVLLVVTMMMVLSSIVIIIVIGKIVEDDKLKLEYELISERINSNYKSYESISEIHNKVSYMYHDLKNHITCLKGYDTTDEIKSYIDNLEFQISDFEHIKNTGNQTLDIILGDKKSFCKNNNIEFSEYINISKLGFIKDIDICAIFSNALDNAIEACLNIKTKNNRKVEVKVSYVNNFSILKFTNTKVNEINIVDDKIQTTKKDTSSHGIGLSSIKYIVKKYDGEVSVNYSDEEFILKIMIPLQDRGERL